jgi:hypothetical protein
MPDDKKPSPDVARIAKALGETDDVPIKQINRTIEVCGLDFTEFMLANAEIVEKNGGMMTTNGERRRTKGGVFFYLLRYSLPMDIRNEIFPPPKWVTAKEGQKKKSKYPAFHWEDRIDQLHKAVESEKGDIEELNIQLRGRPGYIERRDSLMILTMEQSIPVNQTFPRGVPDPPNDSTRYFVFVGEEQWKKNVGNKLDKSQKNIVVVDGACYFDESLGAMAVFTRAIKVQRISKKDLAQQEGTAPPRMDPEEHRQQQIKEAAAARREKDPVAAEGGVPKPEDDALAGYPPEVAKKLRQLYGARKLFQKRLAGIQAMPENKQSGLKAARMMLERTEKEIAELEAQAS